mmetsp:Transcript_32043/g.35887  ORF Transcript_32043/g.35887 Transcript_32043/m.35887 type:complete len:184 (-) Transcript_32043:138-689(-)|eukprot:CAMPEP_0170787700 /NCGR_PEP_ID=MMETSP0733-20121128/18442_1 /TAXON_ID=186038 /ORGANISM="Fragilariopsis kerguelensis, Strain L26-C5" /LENGTH=183 /DNA_ID=CAMNT_0011133963 /DNA_START=125 /DNA_END=676 /DNA_ORIENTATION=-
MNSDGWATRDTLMGSTCSSIGETYSELPDVSDDTQIKDNFKGGGNGVQFRSQSSIEEVMRISRVSNYDMDEVVSYWGESDDHILRKSELKRAVKDMYLYRRTSDRDFTTLGIDDKVGQGKANKKANRMISRNAVMDEQDLQYDEGVFDDELLSDVYSITSTAAKREAHIKAERLHNEIVDGGK